MLEIDGSKVDPTLTMNIIDVQGKRQIEHAVNLSSLQGNDREGK